MVCRVRNAGIGLPREPIPKYEGCFGRDFAKRPA
jgi:hypothetical protein